jgi:hypothetical protein
MCNTICATSQRCARSIMGSNYLGVDEVIKHYGHAIRRPDIELLENIPYSIATLQECNRTHVLVAGSQMTILDVRKKVPREPGVFNPREHSWYSTQPFASQSVVENRWYLLRKDVIANSTRKTMDEQQATLFDNETVPRACELVYVVALHFLSTGERLFENVYARTCDVDSDGKRVYVGRFDAIGLRINDGFRDEERRENLGIAASRACD